MAACDGEITAPCSLRRFFVVADVRHLSWEFEIVESKNISQRNSKQDDNLINKPRHYLKISRTQWKQVTVQISTCEYKTYISNIQKMTNNNKHLTYLNPLVDVSVALCCTFAQNLDNPCTVRITQCSSVTSRTNSNSAQSLHLGTRKDFL